MTKILFICLGNICRSPMAEFVMKDLVEKAGLADEFQIDSAATCRDEIDNPVYPPARRKLAEHGISCERHAACQLTAQDYEEYDLLIGMEGANLKNMQRICGGDPAGKMHRLLDYTDRRATSPTRGIQAILKRRGGMSQRAASAFWQRSKKAGFDGISRRKADDERDQDSYFPHRQGVRRAGAAVRQRALQRAQGVWRAG